MANIDLKTWENHNLEIIAGQLSVRRALNDHLNIGSGSAFVGGFSIESPNTSEIFHYVFSQNTNTRMVTLFVYTEEYSTLYSYDVGQMQLGPIITYAVQNDQVQINSPSFAAPLYGIVGGGVKIAEKVESVNPSTLAINIPLGVCCTFADRIVIASGSRVYINDPGVEIRTFVADNAIYVPGTIYDIFQADQGLYIFTTTGVFVMPPDAISQGQVAVPFIARVDAYNAFNLRNAAVSNGAIKALGKRGLVDIKNDTEKVLTSFYSKRSLTKTVGTSASGDYRYGKIFSTQIGFAISINKCICWIDIHNATPSYSSAGSTVPANLPASWIYSSGNDDMTLVGILKSRDGFDLLLTTSKILELWGNAEYDGIGQVVGVAAGQYVTPPEASPVIRYVTSMSDNVGLPQLVSVRDKISSQATPPPSNASNIVDVDVWSLAANYVGCEDRSRRHGFAVRTDDSSIEIAAQGGTCHLALGDVLYRGQGALRP